MHRGRFDAAMLFASFIQVGESMQVVLVVARGLLHGDVIRAHGVQRFVFSSTAATFGEPQYSPIDEAHPQQPINPYGRSKLMVEQVLADCDKDYGLQSVCLRYFNAAGADPDGELGERHQPETHLIPLVLQAASGRKPHIAVFGRDCDTPDVTCIRDYIHVSDLCEAHWLALQSLCAGGLSQAYNLGNGLGFSVQQVIAAAERVTGARLTVVHSPRRAGDPARLVADASLDTIVTHAWRWEQTMVARQTREVREALQVQDAQAVKMATVAVMA